ncbi:Regulator of G-protein signaling 7 [Fukomys damarensis]|uniref:Regulator of G-protein signaling 7 n=1 Tax=Fukomys damarensis TaxID=885580 RepID=A0A091D5D3_FUKDA|nr:Regulator of G-protein signaling 7 [Fukomys damarensis]
MNRSINTNHQEDLTEISVTICRADWSFLYQKADQVSGDMAQGNNYGQTSNGVADESPNMLVYRKITNDDILSLKTI